jgi:hypothetical protein
MNVKNETELEVLKDIRSLLNDLVYVFITSVPENDQKLTWHNEWLELSEKIWSFPKNPDGSADPSATVEFRGDRFRYSDLLQKRDEAMAELTALIGKSSKAR